MSDLDHLINSILWDMKYRRATKRCVRGKVVESRAEPTADILRRALEPLVRQRDELIGYVAHSPACKTRSNILNVGDCDCGLTDLLRTP